MISELEIRGKCEEEFAKEDIEIVSLEIRPYPEEVIVVVRVSVSEFDRAVVVGNSLDEALSIAGVKGFVTVRKAESTASESVKSGRVADLSDTRISQFVQLLVQHSRTSELQPSLEYVRDARDNIANILLPRHHLVFGRRGSGKTALLAEGTRVAKERGSSSVWINIQTYRHELAVSVFLYYAEKVAELVQGTVASRKSPSVSAKATELLSRIAEVRRQRDLDIAKVKSLIAQSQVLIRRFNDTFGRRLFVFIDDFHYLARDQQPILLDMIHGSVRDTDAWLKVATIQHLTRWYEASSQIGLQLGHDAATIDLDLTLQNPGQAKQFLEKILTSYARASSVSTLGHIFNQDALDRLLIASGAVPRDYLTLCSESIFGARRRSKARLVGVQDVNKAAGDAKQRKVDELEDDAAADAQDSQEILRSLSLVREFCLEEKSWTYFRIDFREKEKLLTEYGKLQMLVDLRFVHMAEPSLSDEHKAGHRAEVYILDLSQYAGQRLKRKLNVLDFQHDHFVLRETGAKKESRPGNTPNKRLSILRRCPQFSLNSLQ